MTARSTDPAELHARLLAWARDHNSPEGFVPAWAAIQLGALDTLYRLANDELIEPGRFGWKVPAARADT